MRSNRFQCPRVAFPGSGEREPRSRPHEEGRVVGIITAGGVLIEAGHAERTRGVMTDDRDRISHRPSAIPNGPLTESGRAGLSFDPSASLPARPAMDVDESAFEQFRSEGCKGVSEFPQYRSLFLCRSFSIQDGQSGVLLFGSDLAPT